LRAEFMRMNNYPASLKSEQQFRRVALL